MASETTADSATYDLPPPASDRFAPAGDQRTPHAYLPEALLVRNVFWFCRLRWIVVAALVGFGLLGLFPGLLEGTGVCAHPEWPFAAAALLTLTNLGFLAHGRLTTRSGAPHGARTNLQAQIASDLLILTAIVHCVGSLETQVAHSYLFHIVLACIFFPRSWSLGVTAVSCGLYLACVALEEATDILPSACLYGDPALRNEMRRLPGVIVLNVAWTIVTWITAWYLVSHLSDMVRRRDGELAETNRLLVEAQEDRARHMLRTTHELKAPFSAIHANVQFLLEGYCGALPQKADAVLLRITARCRRLANEIQEMLQLANLSSAREDSLPWAELDLSEVLAWCVTQVQPLAEERGVTIEQDLRPARAVAVKDHMKVLLGNLLANAVLYSDEGGRVRVRCAPVPAGGPVVAVEDHGIGIPREKLPRIFDQYYRTEEATLHNKASTGLGLAIVRQVAQTHRIEVRVRSEPGVGSTFTLTFPAAERSPDAHGEAKEVDHGVRVDRG